jgi:RNA polymerase sigma factor (sigma-70 family)
MTPLLSSALLRAQSDQRLVELAAAGHDRAFEAIVERYRRPLLRYLRRLLSDTLAEDVVQATFISAWSSLRTGTDVRDLRPWLYRIAHNAAINALKKAGEALDEIPDSMGSGAQPDTEVERREEMRRALGGIAALPSRQRAALLAVAVDGRAHSDIARELGLTDGAVRQLVHRARMSLRTAATAITPAPLLHTLVGSSAEPTVQRIAEVAAGAGSAGVAAGSLKAGTAAVLATGAVVTGGPRMADVVSEPARPEPPAVERTTETSTTPARTTRPSGAAGTYAAAPSSSAARGAGINDKEDRSGPSERGSRRRKANDRGGRGSAGNSGPGSASSGSGSADDDDRADSSGSGSSHDEDRSGHGSGSSGSGGSGHGGDEDGSGRSGSGSGRSGSDDSGSGRSGSGDSDSDRSRSGKSTSRRSGSRSGTSGSHKPGSRKPARRRSGSGSSGSGSSGSDSSGSGSSGDSSGSGSSGSGGGDSGGDGDSGDDEDPATLPGPAGLPSVRTAPLPPTVWVGGDGDAGSGSG